MSRTECFDSKIQSLLVQTAALEKQLVLLENDARLHAIFSIGLPDVVFTLTAEAIESSCIDLMQRLEPWISVATVSIFDQPAIADVLVEDIVEGFVIEPSNSRATQLYKQLNELVGRAKMIYQPNVAELFPNLLSDETASQALEYAKTLDQLFSQFQANVGSIEALCELALEESSLASSSFTQIIKELETIVQFLIKHSSEIEDSEESIARLKLLGESATQYLAIILRFKQMIEVLAGKSATDDNNGGSGGGGGPEPEENY